MKIEISTSSYNERRYGRPWIARVTFPTAKGEFAFGEWVGQPGDPGLLVVDAEPGDIVARGQKDLRKPRNSAPDYYVVGETGELSGIDKADAYRLYQDRKSAAPDRVALEAERDRLMTRLAEIDAALGA